MKPVRDLVEWYLKKKNLVALPASGRNGVAALGSQGATLASALERLARRNLRLGTIVDVGASDGRWTREILPFFPKSRFLCVEAQPGHEPGLKVLVTQHPQVEYVLAAAGERVGETWFDATDPFGGVVLKAAAGAKSIQVPVSTLDELVTARRLPPPFLIKLDTHGYELPILAGAAGMLKQTEALIVEVYNFPGGPPAVTFYEFCRLMAERGFRCIDLFDPLYRPHDGAFWQMDLMFLRDTRPEFRLASYSP